MKLLYRLIAVVTIVVLAFALYRHHGESGISNYSIGLLAKKPLDVTVFVHGTVGTTMGLMNVNEVYHDAIKGTDYSTVVKGMREDPFFLKDQLIEARGLVKIEPSFDHVNPDNFFRAVYPLTELYDIFQQRSGLGAVDRRYYTFGWSGLLSQTKRKLDAIRLYNHLVVEAEKFSQEGYEPRITLMGYSHGGNIILLLGAIDALVRWGDDIVEAKHIPDDARETLRSLHDIIKKLPEKQKTVLKMGQKAYDYAPCGKLSSVKMTLLLGTPIQSETNFFASSPLFEQLVLLYSEADSVQGNDIFSTRKRASAQRLNESFFKESAKSFEKWGGTSGSLTHARIFRKSPESKKKEKPSDENAVWKMVQAIFNFGEDESLEALAPTHRDLWFIGWKKIDEAPEPFYKLFPTAVLTPYLMEACSRNQKVMDVDFITELGKDALSIKVINADDKTVLKENSIPRSEVQEWCEKIKALKPAYATVEEEIKNISKYLQRG